MKNIIEDFNLNQSEMQILMTFYNYSNVELTPAYHDENDIVGQLPKLTIKLIEDSIEVLIDRVLIQPHETEKYSGLDPTNFIYGYRITQYGISCIKSHSKQ